MVKDEQESKCEVGHVNHPTLIQSLVVVSMARRAVTDKYIISQYSSLGQYAKSAIKTLNVIKKLIYIIIGTENQLIIRSLQINTSTRGLAKFLVTDYILSSFAYINQFNFIHKPWVWQYWRLSLAPMAAPRKGIREEKHFKRWNHF